MKHHNPPTDQLTLQLDELPELILEPVPELNLTNTPELKLQPVPELILEIDTDPIFSIRIKQSKRHRRNGASR